METKIGYKVVTEELKSAVVSYVEGLCVQYVDGGWVHALDEQLPLFVFDNLESAEFYMEDICGRGARLFECEYVRSKKPMRVRLLTHDIERITVSEAKSMLEDRIDTTSSIYRGTVFAQSVKLLREVA